MSSLVRHFIFASSRFWLAPLDIFYSTSYKLTKTQVFFLNMNSRTNNASMLLSLSKNKLPEILRFSADYSTTLNREHKKHLSPQNMFFCEDVERERSLFLYKEIAFLRPFKVLYPTASISSSSQHINQKTVYTE